MFVHSMASTSRIVRDGKNIILEPQKKHTAVVVLMHGLGDTADGFAEVAHFLSRKLPFVKFIVPTAPSRPVTINGGMSMPAWYDITSLDNNRSNEACAGIEQSASSIIKLLENENKNNDIPYSRMSLAGFSQGGAMSLFVGLQAKEKLAGILCMSGYLAAQDKFHLQAGVASTPVLHIHGTADPMVRFKWAEETKKHIEALGATKYDLKPIRGMDHTINAEVIQLGADFLQQIFHSSEGASTATADAAELNEMAQRSGLGHNAVDILSHNQDKSK